MFCFENLKDGRPLQEVWQFQQGILGMIWNCNAMLYCISENETVCITAFMGIYFIMISQWAPLSEGLL